jgi:hypothetical protein
MSKEQSETHEFLDTGFAVTCDIVQTSGLFVSGRRPFARWYGSVIDLFGFKKVAYLT